ncbi:unnamed protein product, partial [Mesorhabditis spiculigera]
MALTSRLHLVGVFVLLVQVARFGFSSPVGSVRADACPFPNGSETAMHTYECADKMQITISAINVTDVNDKPMYPMDPKQAMILNLISYNHGQPITDNKVDVGLKQYQRSWTDNTCNWKEIPTLGLLDNIDGCDFAHNCPLASGPLQLKIQLDLSKFAAIINMLAAGKPYELEISMKNYNKGNVNHEEIACVVAQVHLI